MRGQQGSKAKSSSKTKNKYWLLKRKLLPEGNSCPQRTREKQKPKQKHVRSSKRDPNCLRTLHCSCSRQTMHSSTPNKKGRGVTLRHALHRRPIRLLALRPTIFRFWRGWLRVSARSSLLRCTAYPLDYKSAITAVLQLDMLYNLTNPRRADAERDRSRKKATRMRPIGTNSGRRPTFFPESTRSLRRNQRGEPTASGS